MASGQLGLCQLSERTIYINSHMADFVHPSVDLRALRISTMAHEFGHIRMHGDEDRENVVFTSSYREAPNFHHQRTYQREREADLYGALFLVPISELRRHAVCRRLLKHRREKRQLKSGTLWKSVYSLAGDFGVSPALMKRCLFELGWLTTDPRSKSEQKSLVLRFGAGYGD